MQGRVNTLGLTSLNNFGGLWAIGVVSSCLVPGPEMMKAEEYCLLGYREDIFLAGLVIFRNWLTPRELHSPQLERFFRMSNPKYSENTIHKFIPMTDN